MIITKKISSYTILLLAFSVTLWSCNELTEPVLTDKQIIITAPVDNLVTTNTSNSFVWEPLEGATKYQFQIVSPRFDSVTNFIIDSSFSKNMFTYTLTTGKYQWRVRAINAGSQTSYFTRSITIQ